MVLDPVASSQPTLGANQVILDTLPCSFGQNSYVGGIPVGPLSDENSGNISLDGYYNPDRQG
jgi:hypothetical protein